jgi:hypothetical protein
MTQGEKMKKNVAKITALPNLFIDFSSSLFTPSPSPLPEEKRNEGDLTGKKFFVFALNITFLPACQ